MGTMGTPVEVLHQRMGHLFYKDLWDVRNQITAKANEAMQQKTGVVVEVLRVCRCSAACL